MGRSSKTSQGTGKDIDSTVASLAGSVHASLVVFILFIQRSKFMADPDRSVDIDRLDEILAEGCTPAEQDCNVDDKCG